MRGAVRCAALVLGLSALAAGTSFGQLKEAARVRDATTVFREIMSAPDAGIPKSILDKAEAIAIFPGVLRAGFVVGGQFGHGIISVRQDSTRGWSVPAFLTIAGGSFGLQIGGQSTDLVLVIMDKTGVDRLLSNQFKVGGEASAAAGPVGRSAEAATDIQLRAKILSYSRSRGLFAGIALNGSTLASDEKANQRYYGRRMDSREVVDKASVRENLPAEVGDLRKTFAQYAG